MAKPSCALAQSPAQAAPAASLSQTPSNQIAEQLLSQIVITAYDTEQRLRETPLDIVELHEYEIEQLRQTIARLGWMADVALKRMGSMECLQRGDAAAWLLPPTAGAVLAQGAQA